MHFHKMFGDGQTEAGATRFAGACHVHAVEALKDARLVGLRNADAGV